MISPGQVLKVTGATRERLGDIIAEQLDDYETTYTDYFKDISIWWDWHNAVPLHKNKDFPFKGASNLVVPLIKMHAKGMVANLLGKIFGPNGRIVFGRTENEDADGERKAKDLARFWNWAANNNDFDFKTPIVDYINELVPIGSAVMGVSWQIDQRLVYGEDGKTPRSIIARQGPHYEHIPRERIMWDTISQVARALENVNGQLGVGREVEGFEPAPGWDIE